MTKKTGSKFLVTTRVVSRVLGEGTSERRRLEDAKRRASRVLSSSGFLDHTIVSAEPVGSLFAGVESEHWPAPKHAVESAIAFARSAFLNDGAEGETVHLLCNELERARAQIVALTVEPQRERGEQ